MLNAIQHIGKGIAHLFFPRLCEGCKKPLLPKETVLCIGCELKLPFTSSLTDNEAVQKLSGLFPFIHAEALLLFSKEGIAQHLMHQFKYRNKQEIGRHLGAELGKKIKEKNQQADVLIPIPLHKKKEYQRGFNQAKLICEGMAEVLQIPINDEAVQRIRFTTSQTDKSREERMENVKDCFKVIDPTSLEGKHILLVDDVLTTGATLSSCAGELLKLEGVQVSVATIGLAV